MDDSARQILAVTADDDLYAQWQRVAAAAAMTLRRVVDVDRPGVAGLWRHTALVLLDAPQIERVAAAGLPSHPVLIVAAPRSLREAEWRAAVAMRARDVIDMTTSEGALLRRITDSVETIPADGRGRVIAVTGAVGGAGATVTSLATAVAVRRCGNEVLLIDTDPWGTGAGVAAGLESAGGVRWADINAPGGRLSLDALASALPTIDAGDGPIPVLTNAADVSGEEPDVPLLGTVLDAVLRADAVAVVDVPRLFHPAAAHVIARADLTVIVTPAHVRGCYGAMRCSHEVTALGGTPALLVRGPAPGGVGSDDIAAAVEVPVIAAVRPEPGLDRHLDAGRLPGVTARSPLARAARAVAQAAGVAA